MSIEEIRPELFYRDPTAALGWLERAFGLETELLVADAEGRHVFARVTGGIAVVGEIPGRRSPASMGGDNSQQVVVSLGEGIEAHVERARAAEARIDVELRREFFGLTYTAADPEGHLWSFIQAASERPDPPQGWSVRFANQSASA